MNTTDFLTVATAICPDRDFMVFDGKRTNYMQAGIHINSLAFKLVEMGIQKGDRIGMLNVNCPQYIEEDGLICHKMWVVWPTFCAIRRWRPVWMV